MPKQDDQQPPSGQPDQPGQTEALQDQLLRTQADLINFKRRTEEERSRIVTLARADVILSLLPVFDSFDRAFKDVPREIAASEWYGGVQAIKQQFESVLKTLSITRIESVGEQFDPNLHEAIAHEPSDQHDKDIVSEEFEAGYRLGEDVIRHAKVKVSSGKPDKKGDK